MQSLETILQSIQSAIASIVSSFLAFINPILADRVSGLFLAISVGAIVMGLIVWMVMRRSRRIKCEKIQSETDDYCARLRNQLRNKVERLDIVEKSLQEKDRILTVSERERAELAQQFSKIEELSELVQSEAGTSVERDMTMGQMAANLQGKLEDLHNQITQQAAVISELETEVGHGHDNLAHSIVSKTQQLPEAARAQFEDQVVKPLYEQIEGIRGKVDGIRGTIQAIPHRTRENLNKRVIEPLNEQMGGIKETIQHFPGQTKESLDKFVVHPLQESLHDITAKVSSFPHLTSEQFHSLVLNPLQNQLEDLKSKSHQFSGRSRDIFEQHILHPLQRYMDTMAKLAQQFPVQTKEQIETHLKQLQEQFGSASKISLDISKKTIEGVDQWIVQPIQKQLSKQSHVATTTAAAMVWTGM